jgi:glycosyltransferase involved in cell wall biosynthesis
VIGAGVSEFVTDESAAGGTAPDLPCDYLLSVATLEPRKGLDVLLEALARLGNNAPNLALAGQPGWGGIDPVEQAIRSGLAPGAVRVLGRVSDAELATFMRGALAVVVPSRAEGFGLPVVEAMAVGTPVICSDVPAMVEVAGGAAIVVPRGDARALAEAILEIGQPGRREELIRAGRLRATEFTWDSVASRARAVYAHLIDSAGR